MVSPNNQNSVHDLLSPVDHENLNEQIVSQMKALIFAEGIRVGEKLPPERDLAVHFRVSRVVVREALKSLEQAGFIVRRTGARGGAFVADKHHMPFSQSVSDLIRGGKLTLAHFHEARQIIECKSVCLAAQKATRKDFEHLRVLNQRMIDDPAEQKFLNNNTIAFHVAIAEISGNPLIKLMVQSIMELLVTLYPVLNKPNQIEKDLNKQVRVSSIFVRNMHSCHEEIIRAMEARNVSRCEELMIIDTEHAKKMKADNRVFGGRKQLFIMAERGRTAVRD